MSVKNRVWESPFGQRRSLLIGALRAHITLSQSVAPALWPLADLLLRFWIAASFMVSGIHRMMGLPPA